MYLWRNGYVQGREKGIVVASEVAYSPAYPCYAEQHGVACSPMNKSDQPSGSLCFPSLWCVARFRRASFCLITPSEKWAPYILLCRDVNASAAEVAEVPSEREVICDALAVLYRGMNGTFRCKNAPKKRIKGALFTVCFIVDNSFCAVYVVER